MKLIYSEQAVGDLRRLRAFIAEHDPSAAARVAEELLTRLDLLRRFPAMGRRVEQAPDPETVRDVVFGAYVIRYLFHGETVAVLRVWHHLEARTSPRQGGTDKVGSPSR